MSPSMRSRPVMNASWPFSLPSCMATKSASFILRIVRGVAAPLKLISSLNGSPPSRDSSCAIVPFNAFARPLLSGRPGRLAGSSSAGAAPLRPSTASRKSLAASVKVSTASPVPFLDVMTLSLISTCQSPPPAPVT